MTSIGTSIRRRPRQVFMVSRCTSRTLTSTPSFRSAAAPLGVMDRPAPISRISDALSKISTSSPALRNAMPAASPAMPAPAISALRAMPFAADYGLGRRKARNLSLALSLALSPAGRGKLLDLVYLSVWVKVEDEEG